jgi:hypothetical protein
MAACRVDAHNSGVTVPQASEIWRRVRLILHNRRTGGLLEGEKTGGLRKGVEGGQRLGEATLEAHEI